MLRFSKLLLCFSAVLFSSSGHAVTYSYQTNFFNPLHDISDPSSPADFFGLKFEIPYLLLANSIYNISVTPGPSAITNWSAQDSLFGISLSGTSATITRVLYPGGIEGASLSACGNPCLGGAIATDLSGNINQWNLVAFPTQGPYLTFITYNTPGLGSIDGLGLTQQNGMQQLLLNQLNGPVGIWQVSGSPTEVAPVPGPMVGTGLPSILLALAGFIGSRRSRRMSAA